MSENFLGFTEDQVDEFRQGQLWHLAQMSILKRKIIFFANTFFMLFRMVARICKLSFENILVLVK